MLICRRTSFTHEPSATELVQLAVTDDASGSTSSIAFAPSAGSNLCSFVVDHTEYLYAFGNQQGRQMLLGTPVLYPMPNRVRGARFEFDGHTFQFTPNNGTNFIHGLVRDQTWEVGEAVETDEGMAIETWIEFSAGDAIYELFPIANRLSITYTLTPGRLRLDFCVVNKDTQKRLPFGLAIHPYFGIHGERGDVVIQVPAEKWMEAVDLLPTGKLIDIADGPADLRQPTSLQGLDVDDVFWGMAEDRPSVIDYKSLGARLVLEADGFFTHSVVYTPPPAPFFCIENQSCSTNAHNLHNQGLTDEAHLAILDPGESLSTWIEMRVQRG